MNLYASCTAAAVSLFALPAYAAPATASRLNDTGITQCMDRSGAFHDDCAGSPQDAGSGRDAARPDDSDGHAGFSFRKLDASGHALPADATIWSCILDRVTGLVWEMKTDDGGLHDLNAKFTNYGDLSPGDASTFVQAVAAEQLCGRSDWRLPSRAELLGIVDDSVPYPGPTIANAWFPNSAGYSFWTATSQAGNSAVSWYVNFQTGYTAVLSDSYAFGQVRVVSGRPQVVNHAYVALGSGAEILDKTTGLVWQRCSIGQTWNSDAASCDGHATRYPWADALAVSLAAASASGQAWRLPNAKELASLNVDGLSDPSIDPIAFPDTPSQLYWSSTPSYSAPLNAWTVYTYDGSVTPQVTAGHYMVRLVRTPVR